MTDVTDLKDIIDDIDQAEETTRPERKGLSIGSIVLLVGLIAVAAVIGFALARQNQAQPTAGRAPDFTITTFDGDEMTLSELRGNIVIVNFWASWCGPCRDEAPALQAVWEKYRDDGVIILGVAYVDSESGSRAFIEEYSLTYPNGPDVGTRISDDYNIRGVPETFIIDQNGEVAEFIYAQVTEADLSATIDRLLATG